MRLIKISTIEEGNQFLSKIIEKMNRKFGRKAAKEEDAHRALREGDDLKKILARKEQRKLSKELTFQYEGVLYQVETKTPRRLRHGQVEVIQREGEELELEYHGTKLKYKKWAEIPYEQPKEMNEKELAMNHWINKKKVKPGRDHPWR